MPRFPRLQQFADAAPACRERRGATCDPHRSAGSPSPLAAGIGSVAAAVNATIGWRPYRDPCSPTAALAGFDVAA
jgi:hypothetical protein